MFNFDKMLDQKGNTGVYLIYAYVRICSILRKAGYDENSSNIKDYMFTISNKSERNLALQLMRVAETIDSAAKDLMVNRLCEQLYDIAEKTNNFYGASRVLGSAE